MLTNTYIFYVIDFYDKDFLHLENKVHISVIFKGEYTRFEFCETITYGIFSRVWRGRQEGGAYLSVRQQHTRSFMIHWRWSLMSKAVFFCTTLCIHSTREKESTFQCPVGSEVRECVEPSSLFLGELTLMLSLFIGKNLFSFFNYSNISHQKWFFLNSLKFLSKYLCLPEEIEYNWRKVELTAVHTNCSEEWLSNRVIS